MPAKKSQITFYYDRPQPRGRTGHAALEVDGEGFSAYHNTTASNIKRNRFGAVDLVTVASLTDDQIMRGISWKKQEKIDAQNARLPAGAKKKKPTDTPVATLLSELPAGLKKRRWFLNKGRYQFAIKLPADQFDAKAIIAELDRINDVAKWSMFAPFSQLFSRNHEIHNCCSAIASALEKGRKNENNLLPTASVPFKLALWMSYFAFILSATMLKSSPDDPKNPIIYAPLFYFASQLLQSIINAYGYAKDFISMEKNPGTASYALLFSIYSVCIFINSIGAVVTPNACSALFKFPANLFREISAMPGATVVRSKETTEKLAVR